MSNSLLAMLNESIPRDGVSSEFTKRSSLWTFFPSYHLLDEMSDLKVRQNECDPKNDPASDALAEYSFTLKGKNVPKEG